LGTFTVPIEVGSPDGERWEQLDALVDTGSTLSVVPRRVWDRIGLRSSYRQSFELGDGRVVEHDVAEARIRLGREERMSYVVAAEADTVALLGAVALETFFVAPDPVHQKLIPVTGLLL
jgi:aspartyl protease family protein